MERLIVLIVFFLINSSLIAQQDNYKYINNCNYFEHSYGNSITNSDFTPFPWQYYQTSTTSQITDVQFWGMFGWATHTSMGMVMTTNSGTNWLSVSFNDTTFTTLYTGVYFINNLTGWTVGGALQIRKTTNGGLNWTRQVPPPIAGVLNSVYFFDANTGFAIGRQGINWNSCILRTTNGGSTWNEIVAATAVENELSDQFWLNTNTGWMCGRSFLMKTTNGGLNYTDYYSSVPPTSNGINALLCIHFEGPQTGWIGGSNLDHKNLYKTTNGGLNWVFQDNPVALYSYAQINDVRFIDANIGWAAHGTPASGAILYTSNGGTNWTIDDGTNTWFDCLWTYNDAIAYCGAGGGKIWYSSIPSGVKNVNGAVPENFGLHQNYPNPFNPVTNIGYTIKTNSHVLINVFDLTGREVRVLVNKNQSPGNYEVTFDGNGLNSGIYFYKLETGSFTSTKKMILLK